ncbi:MAG: hypothetical protein H7328_11920 [Bdellovibrio sp.]|nr:hypothetical protein [Bdellovibrio sp.]
MLLNIISFIFCFVLSLTAFSQNLCQDLFLKTPVMSVAQARIQVNKIKRVAREIRAQEKWYKYPSPENIEVSSELLKETIEYSIENLMRLYREAPETAAIIDLKETKFNLGGLSLELITTKVAASADKVLIEKLISELKELLKSDKINYFKYLRLTHISTWVASAQTDKASTFWEIAARNLSQVIDGKIVWNLEKSEAIDAVKKLFKSDPYNVPVIVKDFFDFDHFTELWIYGVRPLGLDYSRQVYFDNESGTSIYFISHDMFHYGNSSRRFFRDINKNGKQKERILFISLIKQIKIDSLSPKEIAAIKYVLFDLLHEQGTTLTGQMLNVEKNSKLLRFSSSAEIIVGITRDDYNAAIKYIYQFLLSQKKD